MFTRRGILLASIAAGVAMTGRNSPRQGVAALDAGEFRRSGPRLRLPHPHPRRPGEISVLCGARLHAGTGVARRNGGAAPGAAYRARGDRDAERLWPRQFRDAVRHQGARRDRARRRRDRRQDAGERSRRHEPGGHPRHPAQSGDRRRQRSHYRPPALSGRDRTRQEPQLARPDVHQSRDDLRHQGSGRGIAGAGRVRPFRRRPGRSSARNSRALPTCSALVRSGKAYVKISGAYRASNACARLCRRGPAGAGADRGECRPDHLGHRLAASEFDHAARDASRPT